MNKFNSHDEMNIHLSGLISVLSVQRRRPRVDETEADFRMPLLFTVWYVIDNKPEEADVCRNAFISLHGIGRGKLNYLLRCV